MVTVKFSVGTPLGFSTRSLELPGHVHELSATFEDGTHTFTSTDFHLGTIHTLGRRALLGRLTFRYTLDADAGVITVCGTDFLSSEGLVLLTFPAGHPEHAAATHAAGADAGFPDDRASSPWNPRSQLAPGAAAALHATAREASAALAAALEASPSLTAVETRTPFPHMRAEDYLGLCAVYRQGRFLELFDAGAQEAGRYGPDDEVHAAESVFGGEVSFSRGENLANVIGSTGDPKIAGLSWIQLWAAQFGMYPSACESLNYQGFPCGTYLVGGHVVLGKKAKVMAKGSNSVYIVPICAGHNNDDNVYMAALTYPKGVWLKDYLGP